MTMPVGPRLVTTPVDECVPALSSLVKMLVAMAGVVEVAPDALDRLQAVASLGRMVDVVERTIVEQVRTENASWSVIGEQLGVTKQAAAKRFGPKPEPASLSGGDAGRRGSGVAPRPEQSWDVTTPGGRTLLRFVKRPRGAKP